MGVDAGTAIVASARLRANVGDGLVLVLGKLEGIIVGNLVVRLGGLDVAVGDTAVGVGINDWVNLGVGFAVGASVAVASGRLVGVGTA